MTDEAFQFKQFTIAHDMCAMKVNTDAVLLGAWVQLKNEKRVLDVGTGNGIIALMMAQRCHATIDAIDIDESACMQARENINRSCWGDRIYVYHIPLQNYFTDQHAKYDLIVSNPPFFIDSFKSCTEARNMARHTNETLSFDDLIQGAKRLLKKSGRFCLILPCREAEIFKSKAEYEGLFLNCITHVHTKKDKPEKRCLIEFSFIPEKIIHSEIIIQNEDLSFTTEYVNLTKDYFLHDLSGKEMAVE